MKTRVLLVDDEVDFLDSLTERMQLRGFEVTACASALAAIRRLEEEPFDAVVLDLQMPEMDGLEALRRFKKKEPDVELILLTGHASVESGVRAIQLGATSFLEKPVDLEALTSHIVEAHENRLLLTRERASERIQAILLERGW